MQNPTKISELFNQDFPESGYIRQAELLKIIPFSAATLWRKVKAEEFPRPIKLSARVTAWRARDVLAWLDNLHESTIH